MNRRRFFPAQMTQTEPGKVVDLEVQLRPEAAAAPGGCECDVLGPTIAPEATRAPSRWLKARIVAPAATSTPGANTTLGSTTTSRPSRVSWEKNTVSGATSVAPAAMASSRARFWKMASAAASWARSLTPTNSASSSPITASARRPRAVPMATASVR